MFMDGWFSFVLVPLPAGGAPTIHHSYFNDLLGVSWTSPGRLLMVCYPSVKCTFGVMGSDAAHAEEPSALGFSVIARGWLCAQEISSSGKASSGNATILSAIRALESKSDPKCHATASRLQNMVCGTPLSDGARFQKNRLTRALSGRIWTEAAALGLGRATSVDSEAINKVLEIYPRITEKEGDWKTVRRSSSLTVINGNSHPLPIPSERFLVPSKSSGWMRARPRTFLR